MIKKQSSKLIKLINILNDGAYHDGTALGKKIHLTRSGIWKIIKKLQSHAVNIHVRRGKGYALLDTPLILLDCNQIKKDISEKIDITVLESLTSTNEYLKSSKMTEGIKICLAEHQTNGKGRLNRDWYSPFGKNIYMSCRYAFQKDVGELSGLSLAIGLSIFHTLKSYGMDDNLYVKWPNDIIYAHKKLSGVLIDIQAESHGFTQVIIGIGVNVNIMCHEKNPISKPWTSMREIGGVYINRNELAARLIVNLLDYLQRFNTQGFAPFIPEWTRTDCLMNQLITVKNIEQKVEGRAVGINELGHLMLQLADGELRAFSSGDASIIL